MTILVTKAAAEKINNSLKDYSDKDWNYSRITLIVRQLHESDAPYILWCEFMDRRNKQEEIELKSVENEVKWGTRHSDELGIQELISLRLKKALFEATSNEYWNHQRPVIRLMKQ